ncbi:hypothetical protein [Lysinibacillus sp. NPDC056232]|uniref:hypothetical protein n=1 Tax=Lysinibacillus sp. NPDC056232 TaxID=3345756 RepID=UPI0035D97E65
MTLTNFSKCFGSESKASATNVLCNESETAVTSVLVAKAKRQLQKSPTSKGRELNAN